MRRRVLVRIAMVAAVAVVMLATPASAQWVLSNKDGTTNVKIGFLAQPELELLESMPDAAGDTTFAQNIFLRRLRILLGGQVSKDWTFFIETDSPNYGKSTAPAGAKDQGSIFVQDAYFTYSQSDEFKVDVGMMLTPLGHNHTQSGASLLPVDYGPFTFTESGPLQERVGRDWGVQFRGYPLEQHLEYRIGVFQGVRGADGSNGMRIAGRAVWYPFAADTGFFYSGTFQATKRVVGVGASFDRQKEYGSYNADVFVEQPFNGGEQGITAQFNWMRFDGDTFIPTLPKQDAYLVEAGFHLLKGRITPLFQYSHKTFDDPLLPAQTVWQAGVAYWMAGHQRNLKFTAGRQHTDGLPDRTQVLAQLQLFYF